MGSWRFLDEIDEGIGDIADGVSHAVGSGLKAVGLESAGESVDKLGDSVANSLGAASGEAELGDTDDPKELVHGDPDALRKTADHLRKFADAFGNAAAGLKRLDTEHWTGQAADAFRAKYQPHPDQWSRAADACEKAASSLQAYAETVSWAQDTAAEAARLYAQAQQQSQQAADAYQRQQQAEARALPPFKDPGDAGRQRARDLLSRARQSRDHEAEAAKAAIDAGAAEAPEKPGFLDRLGDDIGDTFGFAKDSLVHYTGGVLKGVFGLAKTIRMVTPFDPYNATHPAEYVEGLSGIAAGLVQTASHPGNIVEGIVGSGWGSDPSEAFGKMVANIGTAVATGGSGEAADVAVSAGRTAAETAGAAGREGVEAAGAAEARDAAATAAREVPPPVRAPVPEPPVFDQVDPFGDRGGFGDFGPRGTPEEPPGAGEPQPSHYGTPPEAKWDRSELIEQPDTARGLDDSASGPDHHGHSADQGGHPGQDGSAAGHQLPSSHAQHDYENPGHHATDADHQAFNDKFGPADPRYLAERMAHAPDVGLAPEEVRALDHYTGIGHQDVNAALRDGDYAALRELDPEINEMASGLNKLPDFHGQVFRGIDVQPGDMGAFLDRYHVGNEVREPAFTSSDVVEPYRGNVQFTIESVNGKDISWLKDAHVGQQEVLFPPGTSFRVTSRTSDENGNWTIHLQDLGR